MLAGGQCEGMDEGVRERREESDVKWGKVSEKNLEHFAELSRLECISL